MNILPTSSNINSTTVNTSLNLGIGAAAYNHAFTVLGKDINDTVFGINTDGTLESGNRTIPIQDLFTVVTVMKRFIMDAAADKELGEKYPYLKEAAHDWLMEDLKR